MRKNTADVFDDNCVPEMKSNIDMNTSNLPQAYLDIQVDDSFFTEKGFTHVDPNVVKKSLDAFFRKSVVGRSGSDAAVESLQSIVEKIDDMIQKEFPTKMQIPTLRKLIKVGESIENEPMFSPGDWCEVEGNDMKWRLDMITKVNKKAPDDWDWNAPENEGKTPQWTFTYNAGSDRNIDEKKMRVSETGLKILFGCRPFVWQQYAILKVESKLRFQEGHQEDFKGKDIQKYAVDLWNEWLHHPSNVDFKNHFYDERIGSLGRELLVSHITKPFALIDHMCEDGGDWDFKNDDNINIFTYMSTLGSGVLLPMIVLSVQVVIPIILVYHVRSDDMYKCEFQDNFIEGTTTFNVQFLLAKLMAVVVFLIYTFSIVPNTYCNFFNVVGAADTVYSRLLSLRRASWIQSDDSLLQMVGYKLDIYLNTSYETALSILNIFVILYTNQAIEIILNALAFTFIARIDEDVVQSDFYDPKRRWITAGAMQVAMQATIKLRWLESPTLFAKHFDIEKNLLLQSCDNDRSFLCNRAIARRDEEDPRFMTIIERIEYLTASLSRKTGNKNALEEYFKKPRYFGFIEKSLFRSLSTPIFERFKDYRCWSRWEKVLFLSKIPDINTLFEDNILSINDSVIKSGLDNFYPSEDNRTAWQLFLRHFWDTIIYKETIVAVKAALQNRSFFAAGYRLIDGLIFNQISYLVHLVFPLYFALAFVETIGTITTGTCYLPLDSAANWIGDIFNFRTWFR